MRVGTVASVPLSYSWLPLLSALLLPERLRSPLPSASVLLAVFMEPVLAHCSTETTPGLGDPGVLGMTCLN